MEPLALPLPTFLIIGAQKSATRWLRLNLGLHPDVFAASRRARVLQQRRPLPRASGPDWYREQFEGWDGEAIVGEATPGLHVLAPPPGGRLRAHRRDAARRAADRDAAQPDRPRAVGDGAPHGGRHAPGRLRARRARAARRRPNATSSGSSAAAGTPQSLEPYRERFGDRLLVVLHDDVDDDPRGVYDERAAPHRRDARLRAARVRAGALQPSAAASSEPGRRPLTLDERRELWEYFADDVAKLEQMLGRDLSLWDPTRVVGGASQACVPVVASASCASSVATRRLVLRSVSRAQPRRPGRGASSSPSTGGRSQPRPSRSATSGGTRARGRPRRRSTPRGQVEQRIVEVGRRGSPRRGGAGRCRGGRAPRPRPRRRARAARGAREAGDRAGEVVEDVGVPHEQVAGIVGGRREHVAQPEARGLRRADGVARAPERSPTSTGSRTTTIVVAIGRDRAPERQQQREARVLPRDDRRPTRARGPNVSSRISRGSLAKRLEPGVAAPIPDRARAAGPTRRRGARAPRRRAASSAGISKYPFGLSGPGRSHAPGSPSETPRKRNAPAMNDVPLRCIPATHTARGFVTTTG